MTNRGNYTCKGYSAVLNKTVEDHTLVRIKGKVNHFCVLKYISIVFFDFRQIRRSLAFFGYLFGSVCTLRYNFNI